VVKQFFGLKTKDYDVQELCIECGKELSAGQLKNHIKKCHSGENLKV